MDTPLGTETGFASRLFSKLKLSNSVKLAGGVFLIVLAALLVFRAILFPPAGASLNPWASDTMGHLLKVEYLSESLRQGFFYPKVFPDWYMGMQFMRYYPPLPYFLLVGLRLITPSMVLAANWFIMLCALAGGLSWLLYRRWVGLLPAIFGGILFLFLPDNLRVGLAEGNLPRVLAAALLPVLIYLLLRSLEETGTIWHRLGLGLCFAVVVLSHAMMAAIYALCCALVIAFIWVKNTGYVKQAVQTMGFMLLGILLSAWWLLPSLIGGITGLNASAMTEALAVFPLSSYLNPTLRVGNPEAVYVGLALLALSVVSLWVYSEHRGYTIALTFTGCFGVLITTTGFNQLFNALPVSNLLWPLRFLGIASFMLLLALMWSLQGWKKISPLVVLAVVAVVAIDSAGSFFLIGLRPPDPDVDQVTQRLAVTQGWREATLDLSRLGSEPSYAFSSTGNREQLFGWAYQGASTAPTVAALNDAIELGFPAYLVDRLNLYGTDDVVLLNELPNADQITSGLQETGFLNVYSGDRLKQYHREGQPRGVIADWSTFGIGRGAQNLAYVFPSLILGTSHNIDDYSLEHLLRYETIVLSGFDWHDRQTAEQLIEQVSRNGVKVIVDLTGVKADPLARIPRFLDVWGEAVILNPEPVQVFSPEQSYWLESFGKYSRLWHTHMLQGLEHEFWSFDYLGEKGSLVGYNTYGEGKVWFVGLNLPYHAVQSRDPLAIQLLAALLQLEPEIAVEYSQVPLYGYEAGPTGYSFAYHLDQDQSLFVPIAHHPGMVVKIDGEPVNNYSYERLLVFDAPGGEHTVEISVKKSSIYPVGWFVSGFALLAIFGIVFYQTRDRVDIRHE
jgi:uncharacterized membrane protein